MDDLHRISDPLRDERAAPAHSGTGGSREAAAPAVDESGEARAARVALFLDFDGTIVDIAARPEAVVLDRETCVTLQRLQQRLDGAMAIVSGRPLAALDALFAPHRFDVSGLHGTERRIGTRMFSGPPVPTLFRRFVAELKRRFGAGSGLLVEDKGKAVSLHWRHAPERAQDALAAMNAIVADLGGTYRVQRGKAVAELVPAGASKGVAISAFLLEPPYRDRCPVFIGDDLTDEHGFEVVNQAGGISIHVGTGPTRAHYRLSSPTKVRALLRRWADGAPIRLADLEAVDRGARPSKELP